MRSFSSIFITLLFFAYHANAQLNVTNVSNSTLCYWNKFAVAYNSMIAIGPTNVFTVELSDISGNFTGSLIVGTLAGNSNSGIIQCVLPGALTPGTGYRVRIRSTDPSITSAPNSIPLTVKHYPLPIAGSDTVACEGGKLSLKVTNPLTGGPGDVTYTWRYPDGQSKIAQNLDILNTTLSMEGKFALHAVYFGCTATDSTEFVKIKPRASKPVTTMEDTLCSGDTLHLSAASVTPNITYEWTGPNGFKSFSKDTSISDIKISASGYYKAIAILNGCPSLPDSQFVNVKLTPPVIAASNSPVCEGHPLYISASDSTDSVKYNWTGPLGFNMQVNDTFITNAGVSFSGNYILHAALYGCEQSDTMTVLVKPYPEKPVANSNSPICSGKTLILNATSPSAGTYKWSGSNGLNFNNADVSIQNADTNFSGIYIVSLNLNGCTRFDTTEVNVKPVPAEPVISSNSPVKENETLKLEITNPIAGASYQWQGPAGINDTTLTIEIPGIKENQGGQYAVKITYNGCSSTGSELVQVLVPKDTGIYSLYPNPNDGNFTIEGYSLLEETIQLVIENSLGQLIYHATENTVNMLFRRNISIANAGSGIYFLRLLTSEKQHIIPFCIAR